MRAKRRGALVSSTLATCLCLGSLESQALAQPATVGAPPATRGQPAAIEQPPPGAPAPRVSLADAVSRALAKNPSYDTALVEIRRAEAVVRESKAAWLPTLYGNGSFTHLDGNRVEAGAVILAQNELAANVTLTVPLFMARQWLNTKEARLTSDATAAGAADLRRTVAYATGRAYLAIYAQKLVIVVDEQARDTAKSHFDYAHQRFSGGVGTRLDEVRARQEVATDEALVQQAYAQLEADEEALGIVVGIDGPLDTSEEPALAEPPSLRDALVDASHRTDVVALAARARVTERAVKDSWSDYTPSLQGIASPFYQNPPIPNIPMTGYELALGLTVPFYDGGLRYGLANERKALNSEAMIAYQAGLRQAESDVRVAFEALQRADAALRESREAAKLAAEALELANVAYRGGAVTNLEVIDAERQARDAATQAEIAADAQRQARLAMLTATGRFP